MAVTKIEWAHKVWNPVTGCTKVSPGCSNCYAERMALRLQGMKNPKYLDGFNVTLHTECLNEPIQWKKPQRVFVCSMGDLFHKDVPFEFIEKVFDVMGSCPWLTFIILTKRPKRLCDFVAQQTHDCDGYLNEGNLILGVSVENQQMANERIPWLFKIPDVTRCVSIEPILGPIDINEWVFWNCDKSLRDDKPDSLDWVIVGGESGHKARPMNPEWVRSVRDQCAEANVPFFFKQWGGWCPKSDCSVIEVLNKKTKLIDGVNMIKVGKKSAGDIIDGAQHREFPPHTVKSYLPSL